MSLKSLNLNRLLLLSSRVELAVLLVADYTTGKEDRVSQALY